MRPEVIEESDDGAGKFLKGSVIVVFDDFLFEKFPQSFNEIQIGRVRREIMEDDVQPLRLFLDAVSPVVAGVIQKDVERFSRIGIFLPHFAEEYFHGLLVAVGLRNQGDGPAGDRIERSDDIDAAPAAVGPDPPGPARAFQLPLILIFVVVRLVDRIKEQDRFTAGQKLMNSADDFPLLFFRRRTAGNQTGFLVRAKEFFLRNLKRPLS